MRLTPSQQAGLAWTFSFLLSACPAARASCDCSRLPRLLAPGSVCGTDGLKYASDCLAICQGVEVDAGSDDCAPVARQLVQGEPGSQWLDWGRVTSFSDQGFKYLGYAFETGQQQQQQQQYRGRRKQRADLLFTGDGNVYGRSYPDEMQGEVFRPLSSSRSLKLFSAQAPIQVYGDNFRDDRSSVQDTTQDPWKKIGLVDPIGCTGFLVGPSHVLTSAHCLLDQDTGRETKGIKFSPGLSRDGAPFGTFSASYTMVPACYEDKDVWGCDFGMIVLDQPAGDSAGFFTISSTCKSYETVVNTAGYPGDKQDNTMWFEKCEPTKVYCEEGDGATVLRHTCDVVGGMSGAPIWDESGYVVAVHSGYYWSLGNLAAYISPQTHRTIMNWLNS